MIVWIIPFLALFLMYIANVGFSVTRIILPILPAIAIIWAHGFNRLLNNRYKKVVSIIFILIISGFVSTQFIKITLATNEWSVYKNDFDWTKENTDKNSLFMVGGQCIGYNVNRQTSWPSEENIEKSDYIWINQNFMLDKRSILEEKLIKKIEEKSEIIYNNDNTKTKIYRVKG